MITLPATDTLQPQVHRLSNGRMLYAFPSESTELIKIDLLWEAGTAYQHHKLSAVAANNLFSTASSSLDAEQLAEFIDYRGILVDSNVDTLRASSTFYTLYRHADDLLPVIADLVQCPAFPEREFEVYRNKRRQEILASQQKSTDVARRLFYETLFGSNHPLGRYADPEDANQLRLEAVKEFYIQHHDISDMDIVVAGKVDERLIDAINRHLGNGRSLSVQRHEVMQMPEREEGRHVERALSGAAQATIRIGRVLPLPWDSMDYARFMVLSTLLGGYFGSRLMSNLREDKGYTYGIYSRTQIFRGLIVFFITADVAAGSVDDAEKEILHELQRLIDEPVSEEELNLVKVVLAGDFLRSVDGIFERSARFCDMMGTDVDERLTDNLRQALADATPADLHRLAATYLAPDTMTVVRTGAL